jgi:uncharacterized Zn-binding protein involved in type VI secretion
MKPPPDQTARRNRPLTGAIRPKKPRQGSSARQKLTYNIAHPHKARAESKTKDSPKRVNAYEKRTSPMSGKPAARQTDPTACPKTGHGTNPITAGSPNVLFDGLPAARQGDPTACGSALSSNVIPNVLINGKPATVIGTEGDHGNVIIGGSGTVIIGTSHTPAPFTPITPLLIAAPFDQQFELLDSEGEPVPDFNYKITTATGQIYRGTTDALGKTQRIVTKLQEELHIEPDDYA